MFIAGKKKNWLGLGAAVKVKQLLAAVISFKNLFANLFRVGPNVEAHAD